MSGKHSSESTLRQLRTFGRLPAFPLFVLLFVSLTVIYFSFSHPHHWRRLETISTPLSSPKHVVNGNVPPKFDKKQNAGQIRVCEAPRANAWSELSEKDVEDVLDVLGRLGTESGVPEGSKVLLIETLMPNKSSVLEFLEDHDHSKPEKWARLAVKQNMEWGGKTGGISEWMVGPLPKTLETQVLPLSYIYNAGRNFVLRSLPDILRLLEWFTGVLHDQLQDLMEDLLDEIPNMAEVPHTMPALMALAGPSIYSDSSNLEAWINVRDFGYTGVGFSDSFSLLPQGMYAHIEVRGFNESDWNIVEWYYNGILYNGSDAFYDAWKQGRIIKSLPNKDGEWTNSEPRERAVVDRDMPPPVLVQPYGPRVAVDEIEKYVKWLDWEFYLSFSQVKALALFDVRFRGERILYEIGLEEAMAQYTGNSPESAGRLFFDTMYGFGLNAYSLVPGFDCPAYATFLPVTFYSHGRYVKRDNVICVFEAVSDHPLQRHTTASKITASRNSYLVVRTVSTVGNYDYTISIFYLDGSVEVKVHASGYIFADYLAIDAMRKDLATRGETQISEYGYRVHDVVVSSLHTHEIMFKADLDVAGADNTMYKVEVEPVTRKYVFEYEPRNTMHLVHTPIIKEQGLDWMRNSQGIYVILNNASTNIWGEKRGYKIVPGTGMGTPPHLAIKNSTSAGKAAAWAHHDLWVVKQHDNEPRAVSEWNGLEVNDPLVNFERFVNDEETVQEDLVVYLNLGVHHISNSQDIPNTLMHWSGTSVMFVPHNYHDRDPSRDSAQGVLVKTAESKGEKVKYFGATYEKNVLINKEDIEPSLEDFEPFTQV